MRHRTHQVGIDPFREAEPHNVPHDVRPFRLGQRDRSQYNLEPSERCGETVRRPSFVSRGWPDFVKQNDRDMRRTNLRIAPLTSFRPLFQALCFLAFGFLRRGITGGTIDRLGVVGLE